MRGYFFKSAATNMKSDARYKIKTHNLNINGTVDDYNFTINCTVMLIAFTDIHV
jgi:hypothetical protein